MTMNPNDKTAVLEKIKKYPDLEERVNSYLGTMEQDKNLSIEAIKAMEMHGEDKSLENIFSASVGADGEVPSEILDVLGKYPEFQKGVNAYLKQAQEEEKYHMSNHALEVMMSQADLEPVKLEPVPEELSELIKKYPDVEEELNEYLDAVRKQQEMHLSIHALKALGK